jgi:hypothetical protein
MHQLKEWSTPLVGGPIPLKTSPEVYQIDGDWERDATLYVQQTYPLPMTVTGITPEWHMGE